jgi:Leucine-rich repeat (LRR) protein
LTNGDNWINNEGWKDRYTPEKCDPCSGWFGISCVDGRVTGVNLFRNNLVGTLPAHINGSLISELDLSANKLIGTIPDLDSLKLLKILNLSSNMLENEIPSLLSLLNLESLGLASNQLSGRIPSISNNKNLVSFSVNDNKLSGDFPDLSENILIEEINCYFNQLSGPLPKMDRNIKLRSFWGMVNQFSGTLPDISNNPLLEKYDVNSNQLSGQIPDLKLNKVLQNYNVANNRLTGQIPDLSEQEDINRNPNVTPAFAFDNNDLEGCFNDSHCKFTNIKVSFNNNNKLPYRGNLEQYCLSKIQIGALCNDGDPNTSNDVIQMDCSCKGIQSSPCRLRDSLALVKFYQSTGGPNWMTKWDLTKPINSWFGVTLNSRGCVECLNLTGRLDCRSYQNIRGNNLNGTLSNGIDSLLDLEQLILNGNNALRGNLPNFSLPNLKVLSLIETRFSGQMPKLSLPNLEILLLAYNQFSDTIPNFNLPKIQLLWLEGNSLTGKIPNFNFPNLLQLDLDNNQLSGSIPNFNFPKLEKLYLSNNQLSNNIPNFNFPNLISIALNQNQLTGVIPNLIFPNLKDLNFSTNILEGCIPSTFISYCGKEINLNFNQKLPWEGDFSKFCATDGSQQAQIGVPCDDGNPNTSGDKITSNCTCQGIPCSNLALQNDTYIIESNITTTLNILANDIIYDTTQYDTKTAKLTVEVINAQGQSIIINASNLTLSVNVPGDWQDTIILSYTITTTPDPCNLMSRKATIKLVNQNSEDDRICKSVQPTDDIYILEKGERIPLDITQNDVIDNYYLIEPPTYFQYTIKNIRPQSNKINIERVGQGYFGTITEDWIDTLYATYDLCLTSPCDTCVTATIKFVNKIQEEITLTNIITPDGDGMNDVLRFTSQSILPNSVLRIQNRWGDQIYHRKDYNNDWDAQGYPGGVYFYILEYKGLVFKKQLTVVK